MNYNELSGTLSDQLGLLSKLSKFTDNFFVISFFYRQSSNLTLMSAPQLIFTHAVFLS